VPSTLLIHPTVAASTKAPAGLRAPRPDGLTMGRALVELELAEPPEPGVGHAVRQRRWPAAVHLASAITSRPDVLGDQDEALTRAGRGAV